MYAQLVESELNHAGRCLRGIAVSIGGWDQDVPNLGLAMLSASVADRRLTYEYAVVFNREGQPLAVVRKTRRYVAQQMGWSISAVNDILVEIPHHIRVAVQGEDVVFVFGGNRPKDQASGRQRQVHHSPGRRSTDAPNAATSVCYEPLSAGAFMREHACQ